MGHIRYVRDSHVVANDRGHRGRVESVIPFEQIVYLDGTSGEIRKLVSLTKDGRPVHQVSDFEFKDSNDVIWRKV